MSRKHDNQKNDVDCSFADGIKLIRPNDEVPLKYTAAMGIMKCYQLRYRDNIKKALEEYADRHNISTERIFMAANRFAKRTERALPKVMSSELNSTELDAKESYSRIIGFDSSVKKYLSRYCMKSRILVSNFNVETAIASLDLKVPLICEMPDGRVLLLLGYYKSAQTGFCLVAADVAKNRRDEQKADMGTLRSLHLYPLEKREGLRQVILRDLKNGTSVSISVTATFFSFLIDNSTSMLVLRSDELNNARVTIITVPEIDEDEIEGLFSPQPF